MQANPKTPTTENGKRRVVNASLLPPLVAPGQVAISNQATALLLPKWRAALAKVNTGSANARILCIGDSTTFGVFSNGTSSGNLKPNAWPTQLTKLFNSAGINAHSNSFAASGGGSANGTFQTNEVDDSRVAMGTGWTKTATTTVGGAMYQANSATTALSFTPTVPVDTFNIFYVQGSGGSTFSWNINGGSNTNVTISGASSIGVTTVTATLGTNTLNINCVSNGALLLNITGMEAYDSSKNWVSIVNAGWPGSQSSDWATHVGVYSPWNGGIVGWNPALTVIDLGINDMKFPINYGLYQSNIQQLITAAQLSGDVILQTFNPVQIAAGYALGTQQNFINAIYALAAKNNIPILDIYNRQQLWTAANANGAMGDALHPNAVGYYDKASALFKFIANP